MDKHLLISPKLAEEPGATMVDQPMAKRSPVQTWVPALAALGFGLLGLMLLFYDEAAAAFKVWEQSTAFGHCFLVLPIAAWLAWDRRGALAGMTAQGKTPGEIALLALFALPLACVWLAAERLGMMEGRQFAVLFMIWLLVIACLGAPLARVMAAPLAYLIFLVPFGTFLVPVLQAFTARFIDFGLALADIPHAVTATIIEIPEGVFRVAEACAGLRFLIAAIAFGALYACIFYTSVWRRIGFIAACVVLPVLANGVRALGIVLLGHWRGSAEAGAIDHVVYGWVFFSAIILLLLLLGLPFREPAAFHHPAPCRVASPALRRSSAVAACVVVLAGATTGPAASAWLERRTQADAVGRMAKANQLAADLRLPAGCEALPPAAGYRRVDCNGSNLEIRVVVFSKRAGPSVAHAWRDATELGDDEHVDASWLDLPSGRWRLSVLQDPARIVAATLWLGHAPAPSGLTLRFILALNAFVPDGREAVLITITGQDAVHDVLRIQPELH